MAVLFEDSTTRRLDVTALFLSDVKDNYFGIEERIQTNSNIFDSRISFRLSDYHDIGPHLFAQSREDSFNTNMVDI